MITKTNPEMKTVFRIAILALLFVACKGEEQTEFEAEKKAVQTEREYKEALAAIEEANKMIILLSREGKYEEAGEYFAPDVVQMISGQPPIKGREAWVQAQEDAAKLGDWNLEVETLDFQFLGDHAVERGRGIQTFLANEQSPIPSMQLTGDYLVFWKKHPEGWKIQYDYVVIESPEPEAAEMEQP
jgi:ketosteroid isomerase-like protein